MKRILLLVAAILYMGSTATFAQVSEEQQASVEETKYKYAYVFVEGEVGRRLKVHIDLGKEKFPTSDEKRTIKMLRKTRSYAAVINFMLEHGYEVVSINEGREQSGELTGISYVMKKPVITEKPEPVAETQAVVETPVTETPATEAQEEVMVEEPTQETETVEETPEVEELQEVPADND